MEINKELLGKLFEQAKNTPRLRQNYDLRTTANDNSQRMLNALLPGTNVPVHRHPDSTENVFLLCGKLVEVLYDEDGNEKERIHLDPTIGNYGCVVPQGVWHTVDVLEHRLSMRQKMVSMEKMAVRRWKSSKQKKCNKHHLLNHIFLHSPIVLSV